MDNRMENSFDKVLGAEPSIPPARRKIPLPQHVHSMSSPPVQCQIFDFDHLGFDFLEAQSDYDDTPCQLH